MLTLEASSPVSSILEKEWSFLSQMGKLFAHLYIYYCSSCTYAIYSTSYFSAEFHCIHSFSFFFKWIWTKCLLMYQARKQEGEGEAEGREKGRRWRGSRVRSGEDICNIYLEHLFACTLIPQNSQPEGKKYWRAVTDYL